MAKCDSGYFCHVCGRYVDDVTVSDLYLRYVLKEVALEQLFTAPDAHIWCNPALARFIVDDAYVVAPGFEPSGEVPEELSRENLDPEQRREREQLVTRAWRRLQTLPGSGLAIPDYPLADL